MFGKPTFQNDLSRHWIGAAAARAALDEAGPSLAGGEPFVGQVDRQPERACRRFANLRARAVIHWSVPSMLSGSPTTRASGFQAWMTRSTASQSGLVPRTGIVSSGVAVRVTVCPIAIPMRFSPKSNAISVSVVSVMSVGIGFGDRFRTGRALRGRHVRIRPSALAGRRMVAHGAAKLAQPPRTSNNGDLDNRGANHRVGERPTDAPDRDRNRE